MEDTETIPTETEQPQGTPPIGDDTPEELSIQDLHEMGADEEREEQIAKELLLTAGTWTTIPEVKITVERPKKGPNAGRLMIRAFAQITKEKDGVVEKGALGFRLSPEAKKNDKGRWDGATRLYLNAKAALKKAGLTYTGPGSVAEFIRDYPVRVRVTVLDGNEQYPEPSNFVVAISAVRAEG